MFQYILFKECNDNMSVEDKHGQKIDVGSYVIYTRVGTTGEVLDTKVDENGSWVLVRYDDLTKLWYNTENIELTDEKYVKTTDNDNKDMTVEDIHDKINRTLGSEMSGDAIGGG